MDTKFILVFFLFIAVAAFITKRVMSHRDEPPPVEEIVSEILPFINDPAALHRKVVRDLRRKRIFGAGTITDIDLTPEMETIRVRDRVVVEAAGGTSERDVIFELLFMRPDDPDEAGIGQYVEFTGILIDITVGAGTPVLTVDPGEILYIGDGPSDAAQPEDEDSSGSPTEFQ